MHMQLKVSCAHLVDDREPDPRIRRQLLWVVLQRRARMICDDACCPRFFAAPASNIANTHGCGGSTHELTAEAATSAEIDKYHSMCTCVMHSCIMHVLHHSEIKGMDAPASCTPGAWRT